MIASQKVDPILPIVGGWEMMSSVGKYASQGC